MPTTPDDFELSELISVSRAGQLVGVRREAVVRWATVGAKNRRTGERVKLRTVAGKTTERWLKEFFIARGSTGDDVKRVSPTVRRRQIAEANAELDRIGI